jgi:hypothetical protein
MRKNTVLILTAALFAAILIGQALTYFAVPNRYDAHAEFSGSEVTYTISTNSAVEYTVLVYDNAQEVERLFIYYDESYAVYGVTHDWQNRFIRQTVAELAVRGITDVTIVNAKGLSDALDANPHGAVLMTSGILPDTVYTDTNNRMFEWVDGGGTLYWIGHAIGERYASGTQISSVAGYQMAIFGVDDCIMMSSERSVVRSDDPLGSGLMLNNNDVRFGLNVDKLKATGSDARSLGFEYEGYSSVSLVNKGGGMICVIGGGLSKTERVSIAQLISSGVTVSSELIDTVSGPIIRNTVTGTIEATGSDIGVHIRMGQPNIVYAKTFFQ